MSVDDSCGESLVLGEYDSKPARSQTRDAPGAMGFRETVWD